jgi:hypothetical protein
VFLQDEVNWMRSADQRELIGSSTDLFNTWNSLWDSRAMEGIMARACLAVPLGCGSVGGRLPKGGKGSKQWVTSSKLVDSAAVVGSVQRESVGNVLRFKALHHCVSYHLVEPTNSGNAL